MKIRYPSFKISHTKFCLAYTTLLYGVCNGLNFDRVLKWFYLKDKIDTLGILSFWVIGLCVSIAFFTLLFGRKTTKPFAITFVIVSVAGTYFINKYGIAIDRSMIMNVLHTDSNEVYSLLSAHMIPYILLLMVGPIALIVFTDITFEKNYFGSSLKLCFIVLFIGISLSYAQFNSVSRAINLSKKYLIHSLIPVNYIQSFGSLIQHSAAFYLSKRAKRIEVSGSLTSKRNLVVVLAIGETSRQKNFSVYGYTRQNTNPVLSNVKGLHLLNGQARVGSTLYALSEILVKEDVPLTALSAKAGVATVCYVNYTLYDNCAIPGEVTVSNCGHGGTCYDEDVIPPLRQNLKSHKFGQRLVVLHLGGGSHGPSYYERHPQEFQRFQPACLDADVVNHCNTEELYNAYDNTLLYVDYVLGEIIKELDASTVPYVLIYLSDHGESLMEEGRIFHGMPPGIALPPEQAQIPLIVKSSVPITIAERSEYPQQDVFDTVLNLLSIQSSVGDKDRGFINLQ